MRIMKKTCFFLFLLLSMLYLFIVVSPRLIKGFYPFGIRTAVVLTGSMEPKLEVNDFVIMKKPKDIVVGDIISFYQEDSDKEILHRVIKIDGKKIITKGDANNKEDKPIIRDNVTGVYIGKIKYLGNIITFLTRPLIFSMVVTFLLLLMIIPSKENNRSSEVNRSEKT